MYNTFMNNKFRVIEGGVRSKEQSPKEFISAFVTNTRLMGSIGMHIHWRVLNCPEAEHLHQFFSFEAEEFGFDSYESIWSNDLLAIEEQEQALIGGLGGTKIDITEKEATSLVQEYANYNKGIHHPLPEGEEEFHFLLTKPVHLAKSEEDLLFAKQCKDIDDPYELINYFLTRYFSGDLAGMIHLSLGDFPFSPSHFYKGTTLSKNTIEEKNQEYFCESLIITFEGQEIVTSKMEIVNGRIVNFQQLSAFPISSPEAAMLLARDEFISAYNISPTVQPIAQDFQLNENTLIYPKEDGNLFLVFRTHNDHLKSPVFRLDDDLLGAYYISESGQLILSSYYLESITILENQLLKSSIAPHLTLVDRYQFPEQVMFDFIESGYDDFEEFVEMIREDE